MAYNQQYFQEKKAKIERKRQINLQKYINSTFDFTNTAVELNNDMKEIEQQEAESKANTEQPKEVEQPKE